MEMNEFEKVIKQAVKNLPENFGEVLKKNSIRLLPREKAPREVKDRYKSGVVFGMFIGVPINKKSVFNIETEPTRIELYKESFEAVFEDGEKMREQIAKTVVHEIGHNFGFSESDLRKHSL